MLIYEILSTPWKVLTQVLIVGGLVILVFYGSLCFFCYSRAKLEDNKIVSEAIDYIDKENIVPNTITDVPKLKSFKSTKIDSPFIGIKEPKLKCEAIEVAEGASSAAPSAIKGYLGQPYKVTVTRQIKFFSIFSSGGYNLTITSSGSVINRGVISPSIGNNDDYQPRYELGKEYIINKEG